MTLHLNSQANFPTHNLNLHWRWRWWDWIQATFDNIFYFIGCTLEFRINPHTYMSLLWSSCLLNLLLFYQFSRKIPSYTFIWNSRSIWNSRVQQFEKCWILSEWNDRKGRLSEPDETWLEKIREITSGKLFLVIYSHFCLANWLGPKKQDFWPKNNSVVKWNDQTLWIHPLHWLIVKKCQNLTFKSEFSTSRIIRIFLIYFHSKKLFRSKYFKEIIFS